MFKANSFLSLVVDCTLCSFVYNVLQIIVFMHEYGHICIASITCYFCRGNWKIVFWILPDPLICEAAPGPEATILLVIWKCCVNEGTRQADHLKIFAGKLLYQTTCYYLWQKLCHSFRIGIYVRTYIESFSWFNRKIFPTQFQTINIKELFLCMLSVVRWRSLILYNK